MGLTSLDAMPEFLRVNHDNAIHYATYLAELEGLCLLETEPTERRNHQHIVVRVSRTTSPLARDLLQLVLVRENVLARRYFYPGCHRMEPYRTLYAGSNLHLSNTDIVGDEVLSLPTGTGVSPPQIEAICQLIRFAMENGSAIQERLQREPSPAIRA